jgi:hypothetical protein
LGHTIDGLEHDVNLFTTVFAKRRLDAGRRSAVHDFVVEKFALQIS